MARRCRDIRPTSLGERGFASNCRGPVTPAQFVGPAIETQTVTLSRSGNSFDVRFTLDYYRADGIQLIQRFAGTVHATRIAVD